MLSLLLVALPPLLLINLQSGYCQEEGLHVHTTPHAEILDDLN